MSLRNFPLPLELRLELKSPIGKLYKNQEVTRELIERLAKSAFSVCVGDRTSQRMNELGFSPNLEIIDMKEQRSTRLNPILERKRLTIDAVNEPGTISVESLKALDLCLERLKTDPNTSIRILIDGEEDLLVLPVVAFFPQGSVVFYGQPNQGLVAVSIDDSRENARRLLSRMGIHSLKQ